MSIRVIPVKIEAYDDANELVFSAETFDEVCATVEIKTVINTAGWPELSAAIGEALAMLKLEVSA